MKLLTQTILVFFASLTMAMGQFYDQFVIKDSKNHVNKIQHEIKKTAMTEINQNDLLTFVSYFCQSDRAVVSGSAIVNDLNLATQTKNRFYIDIASDDFNEYILSPRIRYEHMRSDLWRAFLKDFFESNNFISNSIDETSIAILTWVKENITLTNTELTYPLRLKGDQDPRTTFEGKRGDEIDLSILAIASLRSVGIASRLVYCPAIRNMLGGKIWIEYHNGKRWMPWVASAPEETRNHFDYLNKTFSDKLTLVVANPDRPRNITINYIQQTTAFWFCTNPDLLDIEFSVMIAGKEKLLPLMGRDISSLFPSDFDLGIFYGNYYLNMGNRNSFLLIKYVQVPISEHAWSVCDFSRKSILFSTAKQRPVFFRWTGAYSRTITDAWW